MPLTELCLASAGPTGPAELWRSWSLAPETSVPLAVAIAWLLARRPHPGWPAFAGWLALAAALASPLCRLAATTAAGHMAQHLLLVVVAPALLAVAMRDLRLPRPLSQLSRPIPASALYAAAIWLAHVPAIYDAALLNRAAHVALIAALLSASLVFWLALLRHAARNSGAAVAMALIALLQTGLLGALLTFAPAPWYTAFGAGPSLWGLTPLEDQQLAGLIMWTPMSLAYLAAGLAIVGRLLRDPAPA